MTCLIGIGGYRPVLRNVTFASPAPDVWSVSNGNADGPRTRSRRPAVIRPAAGCGSHREGVFE